MNRGRPVGNRQRGQRQEDDVSTKFYRGYEVVANDDAAAKVVTRETVYRGAKFDRTAPTPRPAVATRSRKVYRGVEAA